MAYAERSRIVGEGIDRLEEMQVSTTSRGQRVVASTLPKLVALALVIGIWALVVRLHLTSQDLMPSPADVWSAFVDQWRQGHVAGAVLTSLRRAAVGYAIAIVVGTPIGLVMAEVPLVRVAIASPIAALQSLPSVTWIPVGILWFGLTEITIVFVVVMGAFPSIAGGMASAIEHIPPSLMRTGRSMGARGWTLYRHVIIPAAMPGYVAGLKQAWAFSWRSLMAAELITFSGELGLGLGQLLDSGRQLLDMPLMIMSIVVILIVGVAVESLVFAPLSRRLRDRRGLVGD